MLIKKNVFDTVVTDVEIKATCDPATHLRTVTMERPLFISCKA